MLAALAWHGEQDNKTSKGQLFTLSKGQALELT